MKILHTSDLHLGISLCAQRLLPFQQMLPDILANAIRDNSIDCVIISGDIFDSALTSAEAVTAWGDIVTKLCGEMKIPVIVCAGNHDGAARLASCSELLRSSGLYIYGKLTKEILPVSIGDTDFYVIPYFNTSEAKNLYGEKIANCNDAINAILDTVRNTMDKTRTNIAVAHCFVTGGEVSESDTAARASAYVGGSDIVSASAFEGFDYTALGHLHKPQTIAAKSGITGIIRYSGTPFKYSFSEVRHNKSFSVYDTETKTIAEIPVPEAVRLRVIEDTYDNIIENAAADPDRDDYMKIIMTDRFKGEGTYSQIKELYPNTLVFHGVSYSSDDAEALTAEEISGLDIISLAKKYCSQMKGSEPDTDELSWLMEAFEATENLEANE